MNCYFISRQDALRVLASEQRLLGSCAPMLDALDSAQRMRRIKKEEGWAPSFCCQDGSKVMATTWGGRPAWLYCQY